MAKYLIILSIFIGYNFLGVSKDVALSVDFSGESASLSGKFDKNGRCIDCKGKGRIENESYQRGKLGSYKTKTCPTCKGKGYKEKSYKKTNGNILTTRSRRKYYNYSIIHVDNKYIYIIHTRGKTKIPLDSWPDDKRNEISARIYLSSKFKIYDVKSKFKNNEIKVGNYFEVTSTPTISGSYGYVNLKEMLLPGESSSEIRIINPREHKSFQYNRECKLAFVIVGEIDHDTHTCERLFKPSKDQLNLFFTGKLNQKQ